MIFVSFILAINYNQLTNNLLSGLSLISGDYILFISHIDFSFVLFY